MRCCTRVAILAALILIFQPLGASAQDVSKPYTISANIGFDVPWLYTGEETNIDEISSKLGLAYSMGPHNPTAGRVVDRLLAQIDFLCKFGLSTEDYLPARFGKGGTYSRVLCVSRFGHDPKKLPHPFKPEVIAGKPQPEVEAPAMPNPTDEGSFMSPDEFEKEIAATKPEKLTIQGDGTVSVTFKSEQQFLKDACICSSIYHARYDRNGVLTQYWMEDEEGKVTILDKGEEEK